jgi:hypothetical protein
VPLGVLVGRKNPRLGNFHPFVHTNPPKHFLLSEVRLLCLLAFLVAVVCGCSTVVAYLCLCAWKRVCLCACVPVCLAAGCWVPGSLRVPACLCTCTAEYA